MKSIDVDQTIENFILRRKSSFSFEEVLDHLKSQGVKISQNIESEARSVLEDNTLIFSDEVYGYTPRHAYFSGAKFMISPTQEEIASNILIPGHRFIPFCFSEILPWNCRITAPDGREIGRTQINRPIKDLYIYFTFFGIENLAAILLTDSEDNKVAVLGGDPESEVEVTVFYMREIYQDFNFREGDGLILTVLDWKECLFSIEHITREKRNENPERESVWIQQLEEGFDIAFDALGIPDAIEEQIAYAFYFAGKELIKDPAIHLGGFLGKTDFLGFQKFGDETYLWRTSENIEEAFVSSWEPSPMRGSDHSLEAILDDIGVSLSEEDIEAYMRDEMFHRGDSLESVLKRCFSGRQIDFYNQKQEHKFYRFVDDLWRDVKKKYNFFTDQEGGRLREKGLKIIDSHLKWMRDMELSGVDLAGLQDWPEDKLVAAGQAAEKVSMILAVLNEQENVHAENAARMSDVLDELQKIIFENLDVIEDNRKRKSEPGPVLLRNQASVYILKISLKGIRPPIWRRLQVPDNTTLKDLHDIFQTAMGWENYHLHSFKIKGLFYAEPDPNSWMEFRDEATATMGEVIGKEKLRFTYEYDFGDSWEHQVIVEKIVPISDLNEGEWNTVKCLKGKRACPPEDCGGIWGYEDILRALEDPENPRYQDLIEWVGDFDPEEFDLDEINRKLLK